MSLLSRTRRGGAWDCRQGRRRGGRGRGSREPAAGEAQNLLPVSVVLPPLELGKGALAGISSLLTSASMSIGTLCLLSMLSIRRRVKISQARPGPCSVST